ncbi:ABC transporter permease [Streptococcus cameli]
MNLKHIWELTKINLLYSNPQALTKIRKKTAKQPGTKPKPAYKSILWQQLGLIALYSFIFFYLFTGIDYRTYPGYFSFQLTMFFLMSITSAFSTMFAVFYNSKDSKLYLPLPVTEKEIFIAKLLSSIGLNLTFLIPTLSLLAIAYWRALGNIGIALPLALLQFLLLALTSILLSVILNFFLGQLLMKSRHRNLISTGLMLLSSFGAVGMILFIQNNQFAQQVGETTLIDMPKIPLMIGFYEVLSNPLSLHYWLFVTLFLVVIVFLFKIIIPNYYKNLATLDAKHIRTRKSKAVSRTLSSTLVRHHLGTLKEPTLWTTSFLSTFLFAMFFIPQLATAKDLYARIPNEYFGIVLLVGLTLGYMTSGALTMVGMSLERENFYFLKSLPIHFYSFLRQKFFLFWIIQTLVPLLTFGIIALLAELSPLLILSLLAGIVLASYPTSLASYKKDYKYLTLQWQNISQLFTRGGGQLMAFLLFFLAIIIAATLGTVSFFLSQWLGTWLVSICILIASLLVVFGLHLYYEKTFWKKFQ